jgi:hypothetical protein
MTITYVVQAGDWLAKIAREHGTTVLAIWNHPENAGHRDRRASPDILYPGDVLRIDALLLPTSPTDGASAPVIPGEPAPTAAVPAFSPWPYPAFKGVWTTGPTWECPGGTCACHPVKETAPGEPHTIVLYDPRGLRMPGARCRVEEQGRLISEDGLTADALGEVRVNVRATTSTLRVEWAPPDLPGQPFMPYRKLYHLRMDDGDTGLDRRLANLGFSRGKRRQDNVADYQRAYSREPTGDPEEIRLEVLQRHDQGALEPFHPQGEPRDVGRAHPLRSELAEGLGSPPALRAPPNFFASPASRASSGVTPPSKARSGAGGGAPPPGAQASTSQNPKGSVVPDVGNLAVAVGLEADFPVLQGSSVKLTLRPREVASMPKENLEKDITPTVEAIPIPAGENAGISWPSHLIYLFNDLPAGRYTATAIAPAVANHSGTWMTAARGVADVEITTGLLNTAYVGMKRSSFAAICQDMKSHPATENPNLFYKLAHLWAERWKEAAPKDREFVAVTPDEEMTPEDAMNEKAIDALAVRMLVQFKRVCETAWGATVYMALSHGGIKLIPGDMAKLPTLRATLETDKAALAKERSEWSQLKRTADERSIAEKELYFIERQSQLDAESARLNRTLFPIFSLGSQKGGMHAQLLAMDYEYFIYRDHPNGFSPAKKRTFEARKRYFAALKRILQENHIKTLHLLACQIGQDTDFIDRVAKELGVGIVAYEHFTIIIGPGRFMGLSSDEKTDNVVKATSVEPPMTHITRGEP